jgi:hypothetical protein
LYFFDISLFIYILHANCLILKNNKEAGDKKQTVKMHGAGRVFFLIYCTFSIIGGFSFIREKDRSNYHVYSGIFCKDNCVFDIVIVDIFPEKYS